MKRKFCRILEVFRRVFERAARWGLDSFPIMKRTGGEHEHSLFQDQ